MKSFDDDAIDELIEKALDEDVERIRDSQLNFKPLENVPKAQLLVNQRLIIQIEELENSLERYKRRSSLMTGAMIFLSLVLVFLGAIEVLTTIGVIG